MRLFFSAGEASGDAYAAELALRVQALDSEVSIEGVGGRRLREAGGVLVADSSSWGAIGFFQVAKIFFRARRGSEAAKRALAEGAPGVFVPIDYGFMNVRLAKIAKSLGWKVLYFSPPGAYRRDRQGGDLPIVTDAIVTPFSWSADLLNAAGANAHWFGHPIKEMIKKSAPTDAEARDRIAILPGSRRAELELLMPIFAETLQDESRVAEFAVAPTFDVASVQAVWARFAPKRKGDVFTQGDTYGVLRRARAGIVCSGTATLEAALCGCPHVVVYKVTKLTQLQAAIVGVNSKATVSQPNIFLQRKAIPEFLQEQAQPSLIRGALQSILNDGQDRDAQFAAFAELDAMLGGDDAVTRTAELIVELGQAK